MTEQQTQSGGIAGGAIEQQKQDGMIAQQAQPGITISTTVV
jgi:hypothetical protein